MYQTTSIQDLKPQAIAQRLKDITRLENENNIDILVCDQWFELCTEESFLDWLIENKDLTEYKVKTEEWDGEDGTFIATSYDESEIISDFFNMANVKKYITSKEIQLSNLKQLV